MLYVKAEDGKLLEIIRKDFRDMKEVHQHSQKIFGVSEDYCLVTEPIHGKVGVLAYSYDKIGKLIHKEVKRFRYSATKDRLLDEALGFRRQAYPGTARHWPVSPKQHTDQAYGSRTNFSILP